MDPALRQLLREEPPDRVIEAIIRFRHPRVSIPGVRIVARFARIATCRLRARAVPRVWSHPDVVSLKAARSIGPETTPPSPPRPPSDQPANEPPEPPRRPPGVVPTGAGVVVGVVDWGLDVDHPNFRHPDGTTRLLALWDQRRHSAGRRGRRPPAPYGYGVVHSRRDIDAALRTAEPFRALGYHASDADRGGGTHGCHVLDIAAGNGTVGPSGAAPLADLVFVHLADRGTGGLATLGDSVRLLEAVDFISRTAGSRPWVINLSMGRHGGPHDGSTLTELALDELLSAAPGRFIAQSAGNYHRARAHAGGRIGRGEHRTLHVLVDPADRTPNELEIWYPGPDELAVSVIPPGQPAAEPVPLGADRAITVADTPGTTKRRIVGHLYHRAHDPNNGDHHIDVFLASGAPAGTWRVVLDGRRVTVGRFDAWLERDEACPRCQARFAPDDATTDHTLGTLANGRLPLVVASYDGRDPRRPPAPSSSAGPTRDARCKPDVAAPGVAVLAARSAPRGSLRSPGLLVRKSGTSMAAPHVTGAVALCLEASGGTLDARQIRRLVMTTAVAGSPSRSPTRPEPHPPDEQRLGAGYLNIPALLAAVAALPSPSRSGTPPAEVLAMYPEPLGPEQPVAEELLGLALHPAQAYRELLYRPGSEVATRIRGRFAVLALPGQRLPGEILPGDLLVRTALGRLTTPGECAVIAAPGLQRRVGSRPGAPSGWYAVSALDPDRASLRVLDPTGLVPPGQLLLRRRPEGIEDPGEALGEDLGEELGEDDGPEAPAWTGTPEQEEFRARVLAAHIARTRAAKGAAQRDLRPDELADVPGTCRTRRGTTTCVRTAAVTAEAAGRLLAAANADLATAQQAGHADALRTVRLTATSGYRGSDHQRRLWLGYFATKYYNRTRAARARLADGPHSDAAVQYLLRRKGDGGYGIGGRIAAPGYSNHQSGIAIDLWQERVRGQAIGNDSDDAARRRWRDSWFHGWLREHAATYGFQPLSTEEWHWEFRPPTPRTAARTAARSAARTANPVTATAETGEYLGGRLSTYRSTALGQPVAVFVPKAALGRAEVDVLVFAHGLLGGCPRLRALPSGFVTEAPFRLGRVVDASARPLVLVVPLLDWSAPGGEAAFGPGHARWHRLGHPAVLDAVVTEALAEAGRTQQRSAPTLRELALAAHSRAYDVLEPLAAHRADPAMRQGALARLRRIWAFDTTYAGNVPAWTDWLAADPELRLHVFYRADYRPGRNTGTIGDRFAARQGGRLTVTRATEGHCAVPATRLAEVLGVTGAASAAASASAGSGASEAEDSDPLDPDLSAVAGLDDAFDDSDGDSESDPVEGDHLTWGGQW
ncbi:MAG: S8 family serine peptidase [Kineosporiaceae bacterium]|nr:S8 family serine peptidase [Kineosporiaceae bacterium]